MDAATLPDLDQLDSKALKSLILELHDQSSRINKKSFLSASSSLRATRKSSI
jgi:hypothetical protein